MAFFDPQENCFEKGGAGHTLSASAKYPDQFAPYNVFGWSMADLSYEGTLFRFPLRSNGDESDLSSPKAVRETVFEPFKKDAHLVPLFLKCVESIKLFDWRPESESPVEVFSVFINEDTRQSVRDARSRINVCVENDDVVVEEAFEALVTCRDEFQVLSNQKWLIAHYISMEDSDILKLSKEVHHAPWIGLALPLPPLNAHAQDLGRMFCFLPLPPTDDSNTGLPVHVHGSFSVADNRRSLKWRAADCKTDNEVAWNELLLHHLVAPAYEALISKAIALSLDRETVYRAWPELSRVKYHWQGVVDEFLRRLLCNDVFRLDCGNGSWISLEEAVVHKSSELSPDESVAYEVMMRMGEPVLLLPRNVLACLNRAKARSIASYEAFDSNFLCSSLKKSPYKYVDLTGKKKYSLLAFALRDENYADLVGLFLLPLNDGSFTSFQLSSSPSQVFIENKDFPVSLFQGMENRFLHFSLPKLLRQKLTSIECCKTLSLMHIQHHHVVSLLKGILLNYWPLQDKAIIPWSDQPSRQWIHDLWRWLRIHKDYIDFLGCFVIPCGNFTSVAKLDGERKVIFADFARHDLDFSDGMSQTVASALSSAGCVVLKDCPDYILSNDELRKYVWTQAEALCCLAQVPVSVSSFKEWTEIQCRDVLSFLYRVIDNDSSVTIEIESVLLSMPLFRLYHSGAFTCLKNCSAFVPELLKADLPLRSSLLSFPNREQSLILDKISLSSYRKLTFEELFAEVVFPDFEAYQLECKTEIVKYILDNHLSLPDIVRKGLNELTFVPVAGGKIKKPSELFHPDVPLAKKLFGNKPFFPGGHFSLSEKYGRLLSVVAGFRSLESISGLQLVDIPDEASAGDPEKGASMLSLFCRMGYSWVRDLFSEQVSPSSTFAQLLKRFKWCPVQSNFPSLYPSALPWKAEGCTTALPSETVCALDGRQVSLENLSVLVGSTEFILKGSFALDECLLNLIGLRQPSLDSVFKNLLNAIEKYKSQKECFDGKFHQMMTKFLSLLPQYWSEACLHKAFSRNFSDSDFIWINLNVGFVSRHRLGTSSCYVRSLEPWLFIICQEVHSHLSSSTIQSALGIKSEFSQSDVLNVLAEIKKYHDKGVASAEEVARDLDITVGILNWITEDVVVKVSSKLLDQLLVPVQHSGKLQLVPPSADVVYGDAKRLDSTTDLTEFKFIHRNISESTAIKLGVSSWRTSLEDRDRKRCLDDYAVDLGEVYGQRELLATRLAGIIRDYPWGVEILKELVQNADDAGASLLHIVYDKRSHSTEKVFSEKWKHLQGPALLVYNDRPFSEKDFKGIQNLGVGNKGNDASKIGQFGIGFNAVYHLTDCPSFISDNKDLCVLDPCMYLPTSTVENPGRRFRLGEGFWENFSDVKDAYYSVFSAERLSDCTLFRFPLRHNRYSPDSPICEKKVTFEEMEKLLEEFADVASDLLLFLNSLQKIKLSVIYDKEQIERFSVSAEVVSVSSEVGENTIDIRKSMSKHIAAAKKVESFQFQESCEMKIFTKVEGGQVSNRRWLVLQSIGSRLLADANRRIRDYTDKAMLPRAGIAAPLCGTKIKGKAYCFLPLPDEIPLPVCVNGHFAIDSTRRNLFRQAPSMSNSWQQAWNEDLIDFCVAPAYVSFLEKAKRYVNRAYHCDPSNVEHHLDWFHSLFPVVNNTVVSSWDQLARQVYVFLVQSQSNTLAFVDSLLLSEQQMLENAVFLSEKKRVSRQDRDIFDVGCVVRNQFPVAPLLKWYSFAPVKRQALGVRKILHWSQEHIQFCVGREGAIVLKALLLLLGLPVFTTTQGIFSSLQSLRGSGVEIASPESVRHCLYHFDSSLSPRKLRLGKIKDTLLKAPVVAVFLLEFLFFSQKDKSFSLQKLDGLPLLVTEDECLRTFSKDDPVYLSRFPGLLPTQPEFFLHSSIRDSLALHLGAKVIKATGPICVLSPSELVARLRGTKLFPVYALHCRKLEANLSLPDKWVSEFWNYIKTEGQLSSSFDDALDYFKGYPVIPATVDSIPVFVPIELGFTVLHVTNGCDPAEEAVIQMGMPVLRGELLGEKALDALVASRCVTFRSPGRVIKALQNIFSNKKCLCFDAPVSLCLLKYFNLFFKSVTQEVKGFSSDELSTLPIFETVDGRFQPISRGKSFCLPETLLLCGKKNWKDSELLIFFKTQPELCTLYKCLGVFPKSIKDAYLDLILPKFSLLSDSDRMEHLLFLKSFSELSEVLESLSLTQCFSIDSKVFCVNDFYDPDVKLFSLMLPSQAFPPPLPMTETASGSEDEDRVEWLEFLRKLGLRKVASAQLLIKFGKYLEEGGHYVTPLPELWITKSKLLFQHFIENDYSRGVRDQFLSLKCLPASDIRNVLAAISDPFSETITSCKRLVQFSPMNEQLCWTSRALAPDWAIAKSSMSFDEYIEPSPSHSNVTKNIENYVKGYERLASEKTLNDDLVREMRDITLCIFEFFSAKLGFQKAPKLSISSNLNDISIFTSCFVNPESVKAVKTLFKLKFIFIAEKRAFFSPLRVVQSSPKGLPHLHPYLHQLPDVYGKHNYLLRCLGVDAEARPFHCACVLREIYRKNDKGISSLKDSQDIIIDYSKEVTLKDSKDIGIAMSAIECLFRLLQRNEDEINNESLTVALSPLFLLNRKGGLELSSNLVFLDDIRHEPLLHRSKTFSSKSFLIDLTTCNLSFLHERTVDLLPERLRPRKASTLFGFRIREGSMVPPLYEQHLTSLEGLRNLMTSQNFVFGLKSIYVHKTRNETIPSHLEEGLQTIAQLDVRCLKSFSTCLVWFDDQKEVEDTSEDGNVYLEVSGAGNKAVLYVTESAIKDHFSEVAFPVWIRITHCLMQYFRCPADIDSATVIGMLTRKSPLEIPSYLKYIGISFLDFGHERKLRDESRYAEVYCGGEVDTVQMDNDVTDSAFDFDERVVCSSAKNTPIYGRVLSKEYKPSDLNEVNDNSHYVIDGGKEDSINVDPSNLHKLKERETQPHIPDFAPAVESRSARQQLKTFQEERAELLPLRDQESHISTEGKSERTSDTFHYSNSRASSSLGNDARPFRGGASHYDGRNSEYFLSSQTPSRQPKMGRMFRSQAAADLLAARKQYEEQLQTGSCNFALVCFLCHECAEKALKGVLLLKEGIDVTQRRSHNLLWFQESALAYVSESAKFIVQNSISELNNYYVPTRYPDALDAVPAVSFTQDHAQKALKSAAIIVRETEASFILKETAV